MELRPRDLAILRHVALYRLTLALIVERLFCQAGGNAGTVLASLASAGFLRHLKKKSDGAFPGPVGFFTLTPAGARAIGVSEDRAEKLGASALRKHLATLWFCCLGERRRHRLDPDELKSLFGTNPPHPNIPMCLADEPEGPRVYRVYETSTDIIKSIKQLRASIAKLWESTTVRPWMISGDLGFAVLAETRPKCTALDKALKGAGKEKPSVAEECHVIVRFAPSPSTLKAALTGLRKDEK